MGFDGLNTEQEKEAIKQKIERILDGYALISCLSTKPDKKSALRNILHEQNYSWPGLALYIDSLSPVDQYVLLRDGFSEEQRATIWPYLSEEADLAWEYNGHPPVDLDDDVRAWPPERQADVLARKIKQIQDKSSLLRAVGLDEQKKRQIETLLHERGLSDEGKIAYLRSLPPKNQYYLLKYAMSSEQRTAILELLPEEIRTRSEESRVGK